MNHPPYPVGGTAWRNRKITILNSAGSEWSRKYYGNATELLHRVRLDAGTYYLKVFNQPHFEDSDGYDLYVKTIADHGGSVSSATNLLIMDAATAGQFGAAGRVLGDFHSASDVDVFKVVVDAAVDVTITVSVPVTIHSPTVGSITPVNLQLVGSDGAPLNPAVEDTPFRFRRTYSLAAGTHYFRLTPYTFNEPTVNPETYLIRYTIYATE